MGKKQVQSTSAPSAPGPGSPEPAKGEIVQASNNPLARPATDSGMIQGSDASDFQLPAIHLFQGVGKEAEAYGRHAVGTWVDSSTQEPMDLKEKQIVPVFGYKISIAYRKARVQGQSPRMGDWPTPGDVPDELRNDASVKVIDYIMWVVLVEGSDFPYVIPHKSTFLAAAKTLNSLQVARKAADLPRGAYALTTRSKSNDLGNWLAPVYRPIGNAKPDLAALADKFEGMFRGRKVTVSDPTVSGEDGSAAASDDIPI